MKRLLRLFFVLFVASTLSGCSLLNMIPGGAGGNIDGAKMTAEVVFVSDRLEVNVIEGEYGASGPYWVITSSETVIVDQSGKRISKLNVGDKIEIIYSGQVMMSYPPQIVAKKITLLK